MPKVDPLQESFAGGEISPLLYGRVNSERYKQSLATCLNYIPTLQGGLIRRPGTYFVNEVKSSSAKVRLVKYEFSTTQAYILEFGNLYYRIYANQAQLLSGGSPIEVTTPFTTSELFDIQFVQNADILYATHPSHLPQLIYQVQGTSGTSAAHWHCDSINHRNGPFLPEATITTGLPARTGVEISTSGLSYSGVGTDYFCTFTASSGIFAATDVVRSIRIWDGNRWVLGSITAYTSTTVVTGVIQKSQPISLVTRWNLGAWSTASGPTAACFHEDRLFFFGAPRAPQTLHATETGKYGTNIETSFLTTLESGTVLDSSGLAFTLNSNDVQYGRWLASDEKGLLAGTHAGEWLISPSSQNEALTPTNVKAKQFSSYGAKPMAAFNIGTSKVYVTRTGRKVREATYFQEKEGFGAPDLTLLAEHITKTGITCMAVQKEPQPILWAVRSDGVLLAMTFERDPEALRVAWHRHIVGGDGDAAGNDAVVESVAVIPNSSGADEVWISVKRYINGATYRSVEFVTPFFDQEVDQKDAFFVDCGLTLDSPKTITGATKANPVVVTANGHGFANGDQVRIVDIVGMTELNDNNYLVANKTANTFELTTLAGANVNGTAYTTYVSGGEVRKMVQTVTGLSHLEGQTVAILGDGGVQAQKTVSGGSVTLDTKAAVVHVGLPYNSDGQILRIEAGSATGTALGKTRRVHRTGMLIYRTLGLKVGMSFDKLTELIERTSAVEHGDPPPLVTGIRSKTMEGTVDFDEQVCWRQSDPLPGTILAVMPQMNLNDRG